MRNMFSDIKSGVGWGFAFVLALICVRALHDALMEMNNLQAFAFFYLPAFIAISALVIALIVTRHDNGKSNKK